MDTQSQSQKPPLPPWERVLWKKQPYPDNYVPTSFLSQLRTNTTTPHPSLSDLILSSLPISQQVSQILALVCVFAHLRSGALSPHVLILLSTSVIGALWTVVAILDFHTARRQGKLDTPRGRVSNAIFPAVLLSVVLLALSPVLRTLTEATTDDSVWALAAFLFILNFALADYTSPAPLVVAAKTTLSATLSLNAAISSSVVLASRLPSALHVFSLILFAAYLFALLPLWQLRVLRTQSAYSRAWRTGLLFAVPLILQIAGTTLLASLSTPLACLAALANAFISIACPAWMRWAQRWKIQISGPWDVAVPKRRVHASL